MAVIQTSISASILIVVIVLLRSLALYKLPKKTFLVLWGVTVFRLLIPWSIVSRFSIWQGLVWLKNVFMIKLSAESVVKMEIPSSIVDITAAKDPPIAIIQRASFAASAEIIWLLGMIVGLLFFTVVYIKALREFKFSWRVDNKFVKQWLQENPLRRSVQIRQSDRIDTPLTYGVFCPVVLFPNNTDWKDQEQLRYVLAHEYIHIKRFDALSKIVLTIAVCVHWFNPFVWLMYLLANRDLELACDEAVLRRFGQTTKLAYAHMLINLEERKGAFRPLVSNFGKNSTEERIVAIMKNKKSSLVGITLAFLLVVGVVTVFATSPSSSDFGTQNKAGQVVKFTEQREYVEDGTMDFEPIPATESFTSDIGSIGDPDEFGFAPNVAGRSWSSYQVGTSVTYEFNHFSEADLARIIADIESGKIQPLSKENMPNIPEGYMLDRLWMIDGFGEEIEINIGK